MRKPVIINKYRRYKKKLIAEEHEREILSFTNIAERLSADGADISEVELAFRDYALSLGNEAFTAYISALPEHAPDCPECGEPMRKIDKRERGIVSLLGTGRFSRTYYGCKQCSAHAFPKDKALGLAGTQYTLGIKRVVSRLAVSDSFNSGSLTMRDICGVEVITKEVERIAERVGNAIEIKSKAMIEDIFSGKENFTPVTKEDDLTLYIEYDGTGVPVTKTETEGRAGKHEDGSAKTREMKVGCVFTQHSLDENFQPLRDEGSTTYFGAIETSDDFGQRVYAEAMQRGVYRAGRVVIIGDGAKWIWNIADMHFPEAIQIVDMFHAKEHICDLLKAVVPDESIRKSLKDQMYEILESGDITALTTAILSLPTKDQRYIEGKARYFTNNAHRMNYAAFKEQGLFVGSGVIEAGCKHVIGKRLKQSGMSWSVRGANSIAALRCCILSGTFTDEFLLAA
jgi:hypothetical protein